MHSTSYKFLLNILSTCKPFHQLLSIEYTIEITDTTISMVYTNLWSSKKTFLSSQQPSNNLMSCLEKLINSFFAKSFLSNFFDQLTNQLQKFCQRRVLLSEAFLEIRLKSSSAMETRAGTVPGYLVSFSFINLQPSFN